jgi:uncharacterized protein YlxW (UPF0749 family)
MVPTGYGLRGGIPWSLMSTESQAPRSTRSGWGWAVPVMALAAGLLFGTSAALARESSFGDEPANLAELIQQRTAEVERLSEDARELSSQIDELERETGTSIISTDISRQADDLAPQIGLGPVEGEALRVTLDDAGYTLDTLPEGYTVDDVVVHQQDVQGVVNALWAGGAEAMMIQDQRIVSTSAVRCVGNTLYLQGRVYSPPYTITAVGDRESMATSLAEDEVVATYRAWSAALGLGYLVESLDTAQLPAFAGSPRFEHVSITSPDSDSVGDTVPPDVTPPTEPGPEELNQR